MERVRRRKREDTGVQKNTSADMPGAHPSLAVRVEGQKGPGSPGGAIPEDAVYIIPKGAREHGSSDSTG